MGFIGFGVCLDGTLPNVINRRVNYIVIQSGVLLLTVLTHTTRLKMVYMIV